MLFISKPVSHRDLISEYIKSESPEIWTEEKVSEVFDILAEFYHWMSGEIKDLTQEQIYYIKVEITNSALNAINLTPTFTHRSEFAKKFFIYDEPQEIQNKYLLWLENDFIECAHENVRKVQTEANVKIKSIFNELKIVSRNTRINYTDDLVNTLEDFLFFLKKNNVENNKE